MGIRGLSQEYKCGRNSGMPVCCIVWYLTVWKLLSFKIKCRYNEWVLDYSNESIRYIRCPMCKVLGRYIDMKHCLMEAEKPCSICFSYEDK